MFFPSLLALRLVCRETWVDGKERCVNLRDIMPDPVLMKRTPLRRHLRKRLSARNGHHPGFIVSRHHLTSIALDRLLVIAQLTII